MGTNTHDRESKKVLTHQLRYQNATESFTFFKKDHFQTTDKKMDRIYNRIFTKT